MDDSREILTSLVATFLFAGLFIGGLLLGASYGIERPSCYAHWADSGMAARWSLFGNCQVQTADGRWITEHAYLALNKNVTVRQ